MKDISEQIRNKIRERIKPHLDEVKPFAGKYRSLEDLRVILQPLFPQERRFNKVEGTAWLLTKLFSKEEVFVIRNFENRDTKEQMPVYLLPKQSDVIVAGDTSTRTKDGIHDTHREATKNGNSDTLVPKQDSKPAITSPTTGEEASANERIRRNSKSPLNEFAYIPNLDLFFETIVQKAQPEDWAYGGQTGRFRYSILESYLNIVIDRLKYERDTLGNNNKIIVRPYHFITQDSKKVTIEKCIINTGLRSRVSDFIYIIFDKNKRPNAQKWVLQEDPDHVIRNIISDRKSPRYLPFKEDNPERPDFHAELSRSKLIFTKGIAAVSNEHILEEHCERLPMGFLKRYFEDYFISRKKEPRTKEDWDDFKAYIRKPEHSYEYKDAHDKLLSSIEHAQIAAQCDDSAKVHMYRPSKHSVGFFLPLYLEKPKDEKDFEVGIVISTDTDEYVASTIFRTSMAYERIRVMGNKRSSWLDPKRIQYWMNPYPSKSDEEGSKVSQ